MRTTMLVLLICILTQTATFSELTKDDLEAIQKVVKDEIAASEQRTASKLAAINTEIANINTEIKVIKTDIQGVKDRVGDIYGLVIAVIALIGGIIAIAIVMTNTAAKLGAAMTKIDKAHASANEIKELLKQNTESRNESTAEVREANRILGEYREKQDEQNKLYAEITAKLDALRTLVEEESDEPTNDTIAHVPAD